MAVVAYYSLIFNNWAYDRNPEWRMRDVNGVPSRADGKRYGVCCPNNREYYDFTRRQIAEFCGYLEFEGIFLDMTFWPMVCYCDACRQRWQDEVGGDMPIVVDWKDARWNLFQAKREEWLGAYARSVSDEIKRLKPQCAIEHQYGTAISFWMRGCTEAISAASDYAGGDLYGGFSQQSFACKLYYHLTQSQPFEYMTSRCYEFLNEHTSTKSRDMLMRSVMFTYFHHGACLLINAIDPVGTFDRRTYELFGDIFGEAMEMEPYFLCGELDYDVAIYFDLRGKMDVELNGAVLGSREENNTTMPHYLGSFGAAKICRKKHLPYTVLNNWRLDLAGRPPKILVLSDVPNMQAPEIEKVAAYVKKGGRLYLSGHSAPALVEDVFNVKFAGFTEQTVTYLAPVDGRDVMRGHFSAKYPLGMFEKAAKLDGDPQGEVLATITLPYTIPNKNSIDMWANLAARADVSNIEREPTYKFVSIHADPPGVATRLPGILKANYGAGMVIWSALPIERAERIQHDDIFEGLIRDLMVSDGFKFKATAPEIVEFILFDVPERSEKTLGIISVQEGHYDVPVHDIEISIRSAARPMRISAFPKGAPVAFTFEDGYVKARIDKLSMYRLLVFHYS